MKSHERLKAEAKVERHVEMWLRDTNYTSEDNTIRGPEGDFLIEIRAHYLGSKSKRLTEPADDVVD